MLPKTAKQALAKGQTRYYTGKPCSKGHKAQRIAATRNCVKCRALILKRSDKKRAPVRRAITSLRRSNHRHSWGFASHFWEQNAEYYTVAGMISVLTGLELQIDHIVPLNHPDVCGLHYPGNFQLLIKDANLKKSNKFTDEERAPLVPSSTVNWLPTAPI